MTAKYLDLAISYKIYPYVNAISWPVKRSISNLIMLGFCFICSIKGIYSSGFAIVPFICLFTKKDNIVTMSFLES